MGFIDLNGLYYEGDIADLHDMEVPNRPTPYHTYNKKLKQWVLDDSKVLTLKKEVLARLDEELRTKTLLLNLTEDEKKAVNELYKERIAKLSRINDPVLIQEITLN